MMLRVPKRDLLKEVLNIFGALLCLLVRKAVVTKVA